MDLTMDSNMVQIATDSTLNEIKAKRRNRRIDKKARREQAIINKTVKWDKTIKKNLEYRQRAIKEKKARREKRDRESSRYYNDDGDGDDDNDNDNNNSDDNDDDNGDYTSNAADAAVGGFKKYNIDDDNSSDSSDNDTYDRFDDSGDYAGNADDAGYGDLSVDITEIYDAATLEEFKKYNIDVVKMRKDYIKKKATIDNTYYKLFIFDDNIQYMTTKIKNNKTYQWSALKVPAAYNLKLNQYLTSPKTVSIYYRKNHISSIRDAVDRYPELTRNDREAIALYYKGGVSEYMELNPLHIVENTKDPELLYNYGYDVNIDKFPPALKKFRCDDCKILRLPKLPPSVITIYAQNNKITSIEDLPPRLNDINVSNNRLTGKLILPKTVAICDIAGNKFTSIGRIPLGLNKFDFSNNDISFIRKIPLQMSILNCSHNKLMELPEIINCKNLYSVQCSYNNICILPNEIPNSVEFFTCSHNLIKQLPTIPRNRFREYMEFRLYTKTQENNFKNTYESPLYFNCSHNNISWLDGESISNITQLICSHNNIMEIPDNINFEYNCIPAIRKFGNKFVHLHNNINDFEKYLYDYYMYKKHNANPSDNTLRMRGLYRYNSDDEDADNANEYIRKDGDDTDNYNLLNYANANSAVCINGWASAQRRINQSQQQTVAGNSASNGNVDDADADTSITMEKLKEYRDLERAAHNNYTSIYNIYYNSYKFNDNNDVYNNYENNGKLFSLDISNNPLKYIKYETLQKLKRVYNNSIYIIDKEHYDNYKIYLKNYNTNLRLRIHNTPIMTQFRSFDELFEDCNEYIPAISN